MWYWSNWWNMRRSSHKSVALYVASIVIFILSWGLHIEKNNMTPTASCHYYTPPLWVLITFYGQKATSLVMICFPIKAKLSVCLTNYALLHEEVWVTGCIDSRFLDPGCRFIPGEIAPCAHWIGDWVDARTDLDYMEKWKFLTLPGHELRPLARPARIQ
jgi:hypothetical protein